MSTTHGEGFFFLGFVPSRTEFPLPATGVNCWALQAPGRSRRGLLYHTARGTERPLAPQTPAEQVWGEQEPLALINFVLTAGAPGLV